jgi:hypothetical protein
MIVCKGKIKNGAIVFEEPLTLPEDVEVLVRIETTETSAISEKAGQFMAKPFFGMWKDREDMKDSEQWLSEQRDRWHRRVFEQG